MPVDTKHSDYTARTTEWSTCRAAIAGQRAIHAGTTTYLPALSEQTDAEYSAYLARAGWFPATGRTLDGLVGMVFRHEPTLTAPAALQDLASDITLSGIDLNGLARDVLRDVLGVGRIGLLVEFPQVNGERPSSAAAAAAANLRPYVTIYRAESIINWRIERVNNAMQPTLIVLAETYETRTDPFTFEIAVQYRALFLEGGAYVQRVYRAGASGTFEQFGEDIVPLMAGAPLPAIPFYPFGPERLTLDMQQSPLLALADLNVSHYRSTADLENGAHFTGLPTPFISGLTLESTDSIVLGSSRAIVAPDPSARAGFLEFSGAGLNTLETRCEKKEQQMAAIGARMLAPEKSGVESEGTIVMRHSGESSVLASIATLTSSGMTAMLQMIAKWAGIAGEVDYQLSTDYVPTGLSAQELAELVKSWQAGAISWETLFANLQRGEIVAPDASAEDERERIEAQGPPLGSLDQSGTPDQGSADEAA